MELSESTISRFGGIARLYGTRVLQRFTHSHVAVIGIGGVGSWTVEALARSGIGAITMVDLDEICITNVNRQLHAMDNNVGQQKTYAMEARVKAINPECQVTVFNSFYSERSAENFFSQTYDFVIDAIDQVKEKTHLIAECTKRAIPVVSCGAAGGLRDPSQIKIADITRVTNDPLIAQLRTKLRSQYGFPKGDARKKPKKFGVQAIYSTEQAMFPQCDGSVSPQRPTQSNGKDMRLNCASGYGSITHMTATVGHFAAERALHHLSQTLIS